MSLPTLHRRTIVKGGAFYAGALAFAGVSAQAQPTSVQAQAGRVAFNGPLVGWLVISPDGGSRLTVFEVDARSAPMRQLMTVTGGPATSVAGAVRDANSAVLKTVASLWKVSAEDCTLVHSGIRHRDRGKIVPFSIWTDFV
jgi:hypothetical protein